MAEDGNLSEDLFDFVEAVGLVLDKLEGYVLTSSPVLGFIHTTVAPLAQDLDNFVPVPDASQELGLRA